MRVATAHAYDTVIARIGKQQSDMVEQQERISTGKRVMKPSDDPVAAAMSEAVQNRLARVEADQRALASARTSIEQAEASLGDAGDLVLKARDLIVNGINASYGPTERAALATQIESVREQLLAVANRQDSSGRNLFGGQGGDSKAFIQVVTGSGSNDVQFNSQRGQVSAGDVSLPQSLDGNAVFMRVPQGNSTFRMDLASGNTGSVRSDLGSVTDLSAITGHDYQIDFAEVGGVMQYSVTDTTSGTPVAGQTGQTYSSGMQVQFEGMSFTLTGNPADGDAVTIEPADSATDLFQIMQDAADALRTDTGSSGDAARRTQDLTRALAEIDSGHERLLVARAQAGEWLNRADTVDGLLGDRATALEIETSALEDLDLVAAYSKFKTQETGLNAALKTYSSIQQLSMFNYIS